MALLVLFFFNVNVNIVTNLYVNFSFSEDWSDFFLFNLILFFNFTILYWFCHISTWIRHRYTRVPHPEPSSLLLPRIIPLGHPSAPAPSIQYRASNLGWRLVSYMICNIFVFFSSFEGRKRGSLYPTWKDVDSGGLCRTEPPGWLKGPSSW